MTNLFNPGTRIVAEPVSSGVTGCPSGYQTQPPRTLRGALIGVAIGLICWGVIVAALLGGGDERMDTTSYEQEMGARR